MKQCTFGLLLITSLLIGALKAQAATAILFAGDPTEEPSIFDQSAGWQFTLLSNITVTSLGFYDTGPEGLVNQHPVGIWDNSGNLIVQAIVPPSTIAPREGNFRYVTVPDTTLLPGNTYVIGSLFYATGDDFYNGADSALSLSISPSIDPSSVHSRNGAIGATLAFPPSLGGPFAIFGPNFQFSTVNPFDVIPAEFKWNPVAGGFEFNVQILGRDLTRPVDIAVYWARGSTRNDTIGTPIYEVTIPASPVGIYGPFTFGGQTLANAPAGVSHLILVVDPQDQTGDDKSNNVLALLDVQLSYKSGVPEVLSDYTEGVLKGVLRQAGQSTVLITSTFRTPREQAEAMYVNLVNDDKIHYQCKWAQLASNEFRKLRNKGASEPVIVTGMTQFIEIDPCCVSHHCCDFSRRQVIDISRQSISGKLFEAVARNESRIDQKESFPKKDPAFHIEIEQ